MSDDVDFAMFSPEQGRRIWKLVRAYERGEFVTTEPPPWIIPEPIFIKNESGETIPPYSILQAISTIEDGGKNYITVDKPINWTNALVGPFLFSDTREIPHNEFAIAQEGPIYRVKKGSDTIAVNTRVGPKNNQWTIEKGSMYSVIGEDELEDDLWKIVSNETPILAITNEELPANGEGDVTKKDPTSGDWTAGTVVYEARNPSNTAIPTGALVMLFPVDAKWAAVQIC
jgi:hypothetical protein